MTVVALPGARSRMSERSRGGCDGEEAFALWLFSEDSSLGVARLAQLPEPSGAFRSEERPRRSAGSLLTRRAPVTGPRAHDPRGSYSLVVASIVVCCSS
jgi:hypothetical protein